MTLRLIPVTTARACLRYALEGLEGAMTHPFLALPVAERLTEAARYVRCQSTANRSLDLLVWDAYRTAATQRAIFNRYLAQLRHSTPELSDEELHARATAFIRHPNQVFPHGTGGAVDVTLLINGSPADMGTDFDEFVPAAARDWFRMNLSCTDSEREAAANREILRSAMESAGFVGIDSEWWHYEYGTEYWANLVGQEPVLTVLNDPPQVIDPASAEPMVPRKQPVLEFGVAQPFLTDGARHAALQHVQRGHYYARRSHGPGEQLAQHLRRIVPSASSVVLTPNGLSACFSAVKAIVPVGGSLIYDKHIYYEVERGLMEIAAARRWDLHALDFTQLPSLAEVLHRSRSKINALFCDNPRNWWLDSLDVQAIAQLAEACGAHLVVDTSVQPLQDPLKTGAQLCVMSLSKYPSLGFTLGGAVLARDANAGALVSVAAESAGHCLGQEAAATILMQIVSLYDRLESVSRKAQELAIRLRGLDCIRYVRLPDASLCGGLSGGQICFHLRQPEQGLLLEKIISNNSLSYWHPLHLACTFGAAITTIEHFRSNPRKREGLPIEVTNENLLPLDLVRLGIGCEPLEDIWSELYFALETSHSLLISAKG